MVKNIWWSVHKEDHEMCERLQEGRSSPASEEGGLLSSCLGKGSTSISKTHSRFSNEITKNNKKEKKCLKKLI